MIIRRKNELVAVGVGVAGRPADLLTDLLQCDHGDPHREDPGGAESEAETGMSCRFT